MPQCAAHRMMVHSSPAEPTPALLNRHRKNREGWAGSPDNPEPLFRRGEGVPYDPAHGRFASYVAPYALTTLTTRRGIMATPPAALLRSWGRLSRMHSMGRALSTPPDPYQEKRTPPSLGSPSDCAVLVVVSPILRIARYGAPQSGRVAAIPGLGATLAQLMRRNGPRMQQN
jgi:hypothetical protein